MSRLSQLAAWVALLGLLSCSESEPPAVVRPVPVTADPFPVGPEEAPAQVVHTFDFSTEQATLWSGNSDGSIVPYDGKIFFRGPHTSGVAVERRTSFAAADVTAFSVRAASQSGARIGLDWVYRTAEGARNARVEFSATPDDAWHDLVVNLAGRADWDGTIEWLRLAALNRSGLLRVERIDFLYRSPRAEAAALDRPGGRLVQIGREHRQARPLTIDRPLTLDLAARRAGDRLAFAVGVPRQSATGDAPLELVLAAPGRQERVPLARQPGWQEVSLALREAGLADTADLRLTLAGEPDECVFVTGPSLVPDGRDPRWNVVLITADTLRRDFLSCYGDTLTATPNLRALAGESILFEDVTTCSNSTCPSHASILTSLYPKDHGVLDNTHRLGEDAVTLAEMLRARGYATGAAIGSSVLAPNACGIGQGFDVVYDADSQPKRSGDRVNDDGLPWLEHRLDRPFFLWAHFYDAHAPYVSPAGVEPAYYAGDPRDPAHAGLAVATDDPMYAFLDGVTDPRYPIAMYRSEVTYLDRQIGRLIDFMRKQDLLERTVIVFTADHGESLGEHGVHYTHSSLFPEVVDVPLLVRVPGGPAGRRVAAPAETVDILPTILSLLDLPVPPWARGQPLDLDGADPARREPRYFQFAAGMALGLRTESYHAIYTPAQRVRGTAETVVPVGIELFNPASDPELDVNLAVSRPRVAAELEERLREWLADRYTVGSSRPELDAEQRRVLEELGYLTR